MKKKIIISLTLVIVILTTVFSVFTDNKSIVSYKPYKDGNNSSQMLRKILADNTLQQEKENMFNYASNGSYIASFTEEGSKYGSEPSQITNGLFSMEDEDGTSYYFRGNVDNNNVQFGEYDSDYYVYSYSGMYFQSLEACQEYNSSCSEANKVKLANAGDKMYWKIVRVNGDGSLRLIYNGTSIAHNYSDLDNSSLVGYVPYNLESNDPKYTGYTYDNGKDSFVKKEVDTWYENALGSTVYDSKVVGGRFCSDSSGYKKDTEYGFPDSGIDVFSSLDRLGQSLINDAKSNAPTLKCPSTTESYGGSYRLKAGLITADEMVLAGEALIVTGNSYLGGFQTTRSTSTYIEPNFWTMTPTAYLKISGYASTIRYNILVWTYNMFLIYNDVLDSLGVRPVINLDKNTVIKGTGTEDDPYVVTEPTKYEGVITTEEGSSSNTENAFDNVTIPNDVTWTSQDDSIARIENGKILGLKEGTTTITGVSSDGLTTYEIKVTVIKNPITMSSIYIVIGMLLILILGTTIVLYYKKKFRDL